MIDSIREVREQSDDPNLKDLDMRIGIHTGKVVAGIIGSKVVRYDIFGQGVLIANKVESNGIAGKVCVTKDTQKILSHQPEVYNEYQFVEHKTIMLSSIGKDVKTYTVTRKERDSIESGMLSSDYIKSMSGSEKIYDGQNAASEEDLSNSDDSSIEPAANGAEDGL